MLRCKCGHSLLQKAGDRVRVRIRGPIIIDGQKTLAKCYWCKRDVEIPLQLQPGLQLAGEKYTIKRG